MTAFECLYTANIKLYMIVYAYHTGAVCFLSIHSRYSFKAFKQICGDACTLASLTEFRKEIEKYVSELPKY